ncbi:uncharacterized protein LOC124926812 [Impatiens glandulifera]|uniref:uncharacterized protein LOC124926812 n=1 Tax=Impatiens glandulifera TaxID=253017 RepID=UPI001FB067C2|nr:uncharacterized protein LOC124926812 [Impatiens glandulifera]
MADDFIMTDTTIDLDLNLEPIDSSPGSSIQFWSILDELENTHGRIEERIQQLEAITTRAMQRHRRQATEVEETVAAPFHVTDPLINNQETAAATTADRAKIGKRDRACLVAEALGLNTITKNSVGDGGGFFDCNVCFDLAKEPILTCCGHLFCWACFHQLPYVYSTARECPSCKGEIGENKIVPIYGNGGGNLDSSNLGFGSRIPPRPKANRVESLRDHHRVSHIPVSAALRRIRMGIDSNGSPSTQIRTSLTESAASVSSISSAINSAERLVEDLETYLRNRILRRTDSDIVFTISNAEAEDPIGPAGSAGPSDEEQLARMITSAGAVSFSRSTVGPPSPEVADEETESSHEVQRRRLI